MSLITASYCTLLRAPEAAASAVAATTVHVLPTVATTGFNVSATTAAPTVALQGKSILGSGPFLYLTVNGTPYKVQLGSA